MATAYQCDACSALFVGSANVFAIVHLPLPGTESKYTMMICADCQESGDFLLTLSPVADLKITPPTKIVGIAAKNATARKPIV